jgi:hypothetical protein
MFSDAGLTDPEVSRQVRPRSIRGFARVGAEVDDLVAGCFELRDGARAQDDSVVVERDGDLHQLSTARPKGTLKAKAPHQMTTALYRPRSVLAGIEYCCVSMFPFRPPRSTLSSTSEPSPGAR